jgi:hypothetical protein
MTTRDSIEIADARSRKRARLLVVATVVFVGAQFMASAVSRDIPVSGVRQGMWALNAIALLLLLATGGGWLQKRELRRLVHDEVSRSNCRSGMNVGFWIAMLAALAVYLVPSGGLTSAETSYLIVTLSTAGALGTFAALELRAHRG